ncbi:Zinc finger protein MAGPIE [Acorus gramineus]|uniref:Zinc finger protein MAGPIE n=1 Tax=Acorus gramineus TaxID=55184 RepID=A0AAV9AIC8_ACOGR|nr:Zinc finger protein MAGPIE [Acorus gramineus]
MFGSPPQNPAGESSTSAAGQDLSCIDNGNTNKRKRRPAGTPDPGAEVISLSPKTLMESDRYVCEICNQGFQRDQNLQMHRRRHKVPWKLLKRETAEVRKRVFVCPEPTCLHHDPCHALGDLVGIKKHFRRKHSNHKQWVCDRCSKGYAVQSDYKAHLKTCGTRGHSCDCGRVFSRVESFIEHQDACTAGRVHSLQPQPSACLSRTASTPSPPSSDTNFTPPSSWPATILTIPTNPIPTNLELQLLPTSTTTTTTTSAPPPTNAEDNPTTQLKLSLGISSGDDIAHQEEAREQLRRAEEARARARRQVEMAEAEFANAKRMRQHAQSELGRAVMLRERAKRQVDSVIAQITCHACKVRFGRTEVAVAAEVSGVGFAENEENSSYVSSSAVTEGEGVNDNRIGGAKKVSIA